MCKAPSINCQIGVCDSAADSSVKSGNRGMNCGLDLEPLDLNMQRMDDLSNENPR